MDYTVLYVHVHEHVKWTLFRDGSTEPIKSKQNKVIKVFYFFALICKSWTDLSIFFSYYSYNGIGTKFEKDILCRRNISYMYLNKYTYQLNLKETNQVDKDVLHTHRKDN